jgi:carbon-monoxide dehydrogenase small subunit
VLRDTLGLTGAKDGCSEGECGACTVLVDGAAADSCLLLAHSVDGAAIRTVEGLARDDHAAPEAGGPVLHPVQEAFRECHALQCGFCTPGFLVTIAAGLEARDRAAEITDEEVEDLVGGNLCRCTGYANIKKAVKHAAALMADPAPDPAAVSAPDPSAGGRR